MTARPIPRRRILAVCFPSEANASEGPAKGLALSEPQAEQAGRGRTLYEIFMAERSEPKASGL